MKRLRDISASIQFPPNEPWQSTIEIFAVAGLDKIYRSFLEQPWFWVVVWPAVFGAAAAEFFPQVGTPDERRWVALETAASYLEALLLNRALSNAGAMGTLPEAAVKGLRAIKQTQVPALPHWRIDEELPQRPNGGQIADQCRRRRHHQGILAHLQEGIPKEQRKKRLETHLGPRQVHFQKMGLMT